MWTRAQDVLPGVVVREGTALTAAWGDRVWTVMPAWSDDEPDGLWLESLDAPSGPPSPEDAYRRDTVVNQLDGAARKDIESVVGELLDDFGDCLRLASQAHDRQRHWASTLVDDLARVSPAALRALDELPAGRVLRALARRPFGFEDDAAG